MADTYEESTYRKTTLDSGLRIITEEVPYLKSVTLGIWVRCGSRYEDPRVNGICHFIEHMLFKGTEMRSTFDIAREIDTVGGALNAFTSRETTCFYCKVLDENLDVATDLLTDIFLNSTFPDYEIEREKRVIFQEILMTEDSPEEFVHEVLGNRFWKGDPLGLPVMGTVETVGGLSRDSMLRFKNRAYNTAETIVCAAGKLKHEHIVDLISAKMEKLPHHDGSAPLPSPRSVVAREVINRDLEQIHFCAAVPGPSAVHKDRHAGYLLSTILGGGMSSRLFQEVREKSGLAYSVYSFLSAVSDAGMFGLYAACEPSRIEELLSILKRETTVLASGVTEEEIAVTKKQFRGNIVLSMESSESRMHRLAKAEYYHGRHVSYSEVIEAVEGVTTADIADLAERIINPEQFTLVALGPVKDGESLFDLFLN